METTNSTILIQGGRVLDPKNNIDEILDVFLENGKIVKIAKSIDMLAQTVICAKDKWVTPGFIDLHVHFREPGYEHKETIQTGAMAAAAGGFTTVCCMPNTQPVVDNEVVVDYILNKAKKEACIRVLPIGAITKGQKGEELANIGKMAHAGACAISEDGKSVENAKLMRTALQYAKMFDIPVFAHCEDLHLASKGVINSGEQAALLGLVGIANEAEDVVIARDILLASAVKARLHICHLSTKGGVRLVKEAKARGVMVTAEVSPHHFTLTDEDIKDYDTNFKMNPPLRDRNDVAALKAALSDGTIDCIATDHAPHHKDEKNCEFDQAQNGVVGLETAVALAITELVQTNILTPLQMVEKLSTNPAIVLGKWGKDKGSLTVGNPADITIIDPNATYEIDTNQFFSKGKNSPFHKRPVLGKPVCTICNGVIVMQEGKIIS